MSDSGSFAGLLGLGAGACAGRGAATMGGRATGGRVKIVVDVDDATGSDGGEVSTGSAAAGGVAATGATIGGATGSAVRSSAGGDAGSAVALGIGEGGCACRRPGPLTNMNTSVPTHAPRAM